MADADLVVSDDKDTVPDGLEHHYEYEGRSVTAMTFNRLLDRSFTPADLDLDEIDGSWLPIAYSAIGAGST